MERVEQGKDICERIEQLIDKDDKFLNDKTKLYCEYCLSLGKEFVDSITDNLYEECENYIKKFSSNEEKEKQFITSYLKKLAKEGKEICKEVDSIIGDNDELLLEKAGIYCQFISSHKVDGVDSNLIERCNNYLEDANNFYRYKSTFNKINIDGREKESWLDMRNMRLNGNI